MMREGRGKRIERRFGLPTVGRGREKVWVAELELGLLS